MPSFVQDNLASVTLMTEFKQPVTVALITQGQDWRIRQKIAYEAIKGFAKEDFLGLNDYAEQMKLFSNANLPQLKAPYATIQNLIPLNRKVLADLAPVPGLGWVGKFLLKIYGLSVTFLSPADILTKP